MTAPKKPTLKTTKPSKSNTKTKSKTKSKTTAEATSSAVSDHSDAVEGQLVRLHELKGFTALFLPAELEQLLSEANYQALREELRWFTITVMVRDVDRLIHVDLPVILTQREPLLPGKAATTQRRRTSRKGADRG